MKTLAAILLLAGTAFLVVSGHAIPQNCSARYQSALSEALDTWEACGDTPAYDCCQIANMAALLNSDDQLYQPQSGVTTIAQVCSADLCDYPFLANAFNSDMKARCDMETGEGGWLVIQRRVSGGTENFYREWADYEMGFGDLRGEFWYGLKNIHCLTTRDDVELRIDLEQEDGTMVTWTYQQFQVAGESDNYQLNIGQGEGTTLYDFMEYQNNQPFSTFDADNDVWSDNCAASWKGGWWYNQCYRANLNGLHESSNVNERLTIYQEGVGHTDISSVEMKIRPNPALKLPRNVNCVIQHNIRLTMLGLARVVVRSILNITIEGLQSW